MKRITAFILSAIMCIGLLEAPQAEVMAASVSAVGTTDTAVKNDISVSGTDSVGRLISTAVSSEAEEQLANSGSNIFSVEMNGNVATVDYEAGAQASLIVAIYEEDGIKMLASGKADVEAGAALTTVTIETEAMPQYYYLKAFLVASDTLAPLCTAYESPNYTCEMQEFFATTTADFDENLVVNLDDDPNNNFMVLDENTVQAASDDAKNILLSEDEENLTYVFQNADDTITGLVVGDIFSYEKEDGGLILVKVASVATADGITTVTGADADMEDIFDFVKINAVTSMDDAYVGEDGADDEVEYAGVDDSADSGVIGLNTADVRYATPLENELKAETSLKYNIAKKKWGNDDTNAELSGSVKLKVACKLKIYLSFTYYHVELKADYSLTGALSFKGTAKGSIPLCVIGWNLLDGVILEVRPSVVAEFSADITASISLTASAGCELDKKTGFRDLTSTPVISSDLKGEASVFIGISLEPRLKVISDNVLSVKLTAKAGAEIKATLSVLSASTELKKHLCKECIDGEINFKAEIGASANILNKFKFDEKLEYKYKITDWYYSFDYNEWGLGECPHKNKSSSDSDGGDSGTNSGGQGDSAFGSDGLPRILKETFVNSTANIVKGDGTLWIWGYDPFTHEKNTPPHKVMDNVRNAYLGRYNVVLKTDGTLWTWGEFFSSGALGNGTWDVNEEPQKIMDNVKEIYSYGEEVAAIKDDDSLWMWGANDDGELGIGYTEWAVISPTKVMDDVKEVSFRESWNFILKNDGTLYRTGVIHGGEHVMTPVMVMEGVKSLWSSCNYGSYNPWMAVIKEDNSLWAWDDKPYAEASAAAGDGLADYFGSVPAKVMDDVKAVGIVGTRNAVVKNDGSLWTWGWQNNYGELGYGTNPMSPQISSDPICIDNNVKDVFLYGNTLVYLKNDASVWMCGRNWNGQIYGLDDDRTKVPVKVMDATVTASVPNDSIISAVYNNSLPQQDMRLLASEYTTSVTLNGLTPFSIYNYYEIADDMAADILVPQNLLYINQGVSDENGTLTLDYELRQQVADATAFAMGISNEYADTTSRTELDGLTQKALLRAATRISDVSAQTPAQIEVSLSDGKNAEISKTVLQKLSDISNDPSKRDIVLKIEAESENGDYMWSIDPSGFDMSAIGDTTSLSVTRTGTSGGEGNIPNEALLSCAKGRDSEQINFASAGAMGFDATLTLPVDKESGMKAVCLKYDNVGAVFSLKTSEVISDGMINFDISDSDDMAIIYAVNGDIDGDGEVSVKDVQAALKHTTGRKILSPLEVGVGDVSGTGGMSHDEQVTISDVQKLLKFVSRRITEL